jgi:hypothetical protein
MVDAPNSAGRPTRCTAGCGTSIHQPSSGRPRLYCSAACRRAASRRRAYGLPIDSPRVRHEGRRPLPAILRRQRASAGG